MPAPLAVFALVPLVIKTAIGAKLIGFVASWATSPTNAAMRRSFIEHTEHVREGLQHTGFSLGNADDADLLANIETLRESAGRGWTEPRETLALWSVMKFRSCSIGVHTSIRRRAASTP